TWRCSRRRWGPDAEATDKLFAPAGILAQTAAMRYDTALRAGLAALLVALLPPTPPAAQPARSEAAAVEAPTRLPAAVATRHRLELPDRSLAFTATAGALVITDDRGREEAEIGFVAYVLDAADGTERPITFAMNGGPGAAAA